MTETMIRERAARLQIEMDSLCDEAGRLGFCIDVARKASEGRHRSATYSVTLSRGRLPDPLTMSTGSALI